MRIREANPEDAKGIVNVRSQSWQYNYKNIIDKDDLKFSKEDFKKEIEMRRNQISSKKELIQYVAEVGEGKIVGWLAGDKVNSKKEDSELEVELHTLYILPEHQNKGIGTKMFNRYCRYLKKNNINSFFLWVLKENVQARKFYEKRGGKVFDEKQYRDKYKASKYKWDKLSEKI